MKNIFLIIIFISITVFAYSQNVISIKGKVTDQNGMPVENAKVFLVNNGKDSCKITDKDGNYIFNGVKKDDRYYISSGKNNYLSRINYYKTDTSNMSRIIDIPFILRERKMAKINTSDIGKNDLGITLKAAIIKFKLDTLECRIENEPYAISRGIFTETGDSTIIYLQIERTFNDVAKYINILNSKVIGIGLVYPDCSRKKYGEGFVWYGMRSPYCTEE